MCPCTGSRFAVLAFVAVLAQPAIADHQELDELLVTARKNILEFELADTVDIGPDSARLLRRAPGADVNRNGPLTGIAQYRGMYGNRINVQVNGAVLSAGGPNWMDPPLSYAPAALLESLVVYRGIAPVSAGQETLGGVINARTWSGDFTSGGTDVSGRARAGAQSVNDANLLSGMLVFASSNQRLRLSAFTESGNDAEFRDGEILPTEFDRQRYDVGYGFRFGDHTVQIDYGRNETGDAGSPALPMDIEYIDSDLGALRYDYDGGALQVRAKLYGSDIDHGMTNFHLRQAPVDGAMWRRNIATGENRGFSIVTDVNGWTFGIDAHEEKHNSDISNPNNPMFFVVNFNGAERRVIGLFAERSQTFGGNWTTELGVRYNNVSMDAGVVDGTPAIMMPPAMALRDRFNAANRSISNDNFEWVAKLYNQLSPAVRLYGGVSRKTRSPSYQERYLWLPLESTGGLADMRTYTGSINLSPEISHEIEMGFDWQTERATASPRFFYRDVSDYIQGTVSSNTDAIMFVEMLNMMNGTNKPSPLEFNNVDAHLYGVDVDWRYLIDDSWSLSGLINYVRGKRDDIDDNLYRIAPLNALVAVNYESGKLALTLESHLYGKQDKVSVTNGELETAGYASINLAGSWRYDDGVRLGFGIDNIADRNFSSHLGGYNRVAGNPAVAVGERLPAFGRSVYARVDIGW